MNTLRLHSLFASLLAALVFAGCQTAAHVSSAPPINPLPVTVDSPRSGTSGFELIPSPAVGWPSSDGGTGHYYQAVLAPAGVTWDEAQSWAVAHGGQLATIGSAKANDFVYKLVRDRRYWSPIVSADGSNAFGGPWLGATFLAPATGAAPGWVWADRSEPFSFTNWAPNQTGNNLRLNNRLHYYSEHPGVFTKTWSQRPGDQRQRGFVVEYSSPSLAPAGTQLEVLLADPVVAWTETPGGRVRYFQAVSAPRAIFWHEAQAVAAAHGGHLVTITSAAQNDFIFNLTKDDRFWCVYRSNSCGPLLGGYKAPISKAESIWLWLRGYRAPTVQDGTVWKWAGGEGPFTYTNWAPGQPDSSNYNTNRAPGQPFNPNENETCLQYYVDGGEGTRLPTWNDQPESANEFGFVIEYGGEAVAVPPGSEPGAFPLN